MKIQVRRLAIALAIGGPLAVATTAKSSAAPINGMSIKAAVPAVTTDVRYRAHRDDSYPSYWGYPSYYNYGYPTYYYYGYPAIGPIHRIGDIRGTTLTAGGDAKHRQRAVCKVGP